MPSEQRPQPKDRFQRRSSSVALLTGLALLGVSSETTVASAADANPSTDPEAQAVQPAARDLVPYSGRGSHLVVYPVLFPSSLTLTYAGIRIGAVSQSENYRPFASTSDTFDQVNATAAFDVEKLVTRNLSVFASAVGSMSTGVTVGTLLANGATLGGGFDVGLKGGCAPRSWLRFGVAGAAGERFGESLLFERAAPAIDVNIVSEQVGDAANTLKSVLGNIPVPYIDATERLDATGIAVPLGVLSFQADIGLEHRHRYFRTNASSTVGVLGGDDVEQIAGHFGLAAELDLDAIFPKGMRGGGNVPLAVTAEVVASPTHVAYSTVEGAAGPASLTLSGCEWASAASIHYASASSPSLDAALTFLYGWNELPGESAVLMAGKPDTAHSVGGQIMARYLW